jgi:hypothetical protein
VFLGVQGVGLRVKVKFSVFGVWFLEFWDWGVEGEMWGVDFGDLHFNEPSQL